MCDRQTVLEICNAHLLYRLYQFNRENLDSLPPRISLLKSACISVAASMHMRERESTEGRRWNLHLSSEAGRVIIPSMGLSITAVSRRTWIGSLITHSRLARAPPHGPQSRPHLTLLRVKAQSKIHLPQYISGMAN